MSARIDHGDVARNILAYVQDRAMPSEQASVTAAQVHATLALVEQQRIANLIALGQQSDAFEEALPILRDEAASALMEFRPTPGDPINGPDEFPYTRHEIKEALGLS